MRDPVITVKSPITTSAIYNWTHTRKIRGQSENLEYVDQSIYSACGAVIQIELNEPTQGVLVIALGVAKNLNDRTSLEKWIGIYSEDKACIKLTPEVTEATLVVTLDVTPGKIDPNDPLKWLAVNVARSPAKDGKLLNFLVDNNCKEFLIELNRFRKSNPKSPADTVFHTIVAIISKIKKLRWANSNIESNQLVKMLVSFIEGKRETIKLRHIASILNPLSDKK